MIIFGADFEPFVDFNIKAMKLRINVFHPSEELHSPSYPGGEIMMRYSFQNVKMSQILIYCGSLDGSYVLTLENAHFCIKLRVELFAKWWRITICIRSNEGSIHLCGVIAGSNSEHIEVTNLKWDFIRHSRLSASKEWIDSLVMLNECQIECAC